MEVSYMMCGAHSSLTVSFLDRLKLFLFLFRSTTQFHGGSEATEFTSYNW